MQNIRTAPQLLVRIFIRPLFPFFQWLVLTLGIIKAPKERQQFLLGSLKKELSSSDAKQHLRTQGFFSNRIAFNDPGQTLSMRKLSLEDPRWQYHVRIFEDGEVRGHFERTPEDYPLRHLRSDGQIKKEEDFNFFLKDILE